MEFSVEKFISPFVKAQFPSFYQEEGPNFILFMKAYYEWMQESGNPILESRNLFDYRDIDNTLEQFLEFFQKKYLYGIPFNVIANKRFLLKHILDVYRSKGTIQCYRLLFKLLYNEDIEVYLPGRDVLRFSDGTWIVPMYIEVTNTDNLYEYIGKTIVGTSSGTIAVVENITKENIHTDIVNTIYLSNVLPKGGDFKIGEKIVSSDQANDPDAINRAPTIIGSLNDIEVTSGGQGFNIGDTVKIAQKDVTNNNIITSYGFDGLMRVTSLSRGQGALSFDIRNAGFGYLANAETWVYTNPSDLTGSGAGFDVGTLSSTQPISYNTDLIGDYSNVTLNAVSFGIGNTTANLTSTIQSALTFRTDLFGSILSLTNIRTGNGYQTAANVFVRSVQTSRVLTGNIAFNTGSNTVTGTGTLFQTIFENGDVIGMVRTGNTAAGIELQVIKTVTSNTSLVLYGPPSVNSTANSKYVAAPTILPSNYAVYEPVMFRSDGTINGENEEIFALINSGNNIVSGLSVVNSGKGYVDGEDVRLYLYSAISNNIVITNGGMGYSNNDPIIFAGGEPGTTATGFVTTNNTGGIVSTTIPYAGSGYTDIPELRVKSANGVGAVLNASLTEFNISSSITGRVRKAGVGRGKGYFSTTRGFFNADKYIQDSYYYQDYSYEIRTSQTLNKYKDILYNTFHSAGSELFGKFLLISKETSLIDVVFESTGANTSPSLVYMSADSSYWSADTSKTIDSLTF